MFFLEISLNSNIFRCSASNKIIVFHHRNLSTTEISTALRPFYFSVHPDLFGQHPDQRVHLFICLNLKNIIFVFLQTTNENSLKTLSSVLQNLKLGRPLKPVTLLFYVKDKKEKDATRNQKITFHSVKININHRDVRSAIVEILKACNLETEYIDKLSPPPPPPSQNVKFKNNDFDFTNINENHPMYAHAAVRNKIKEAKELLKLCNWLHKNHKDALEKSEKHRPFKEEINKLCKHIVEDLGLKEIKWDCGWNDTHFRGCLLSFRSLMEQHPKAMETLRGRLKIFIC